MSEASDSAIISKPVENDHQTLRGFNYIPRRLLSHGTQVTLAVDWHHRSRWKCGEINRTFSCSLVVTSDQVAYFECQDAALSLKFPWRARAQGCDEMGWITAEVKEKLELLLRNSY